MRNVEEAKEAIRLFNGSVSSILHQHVFMYVFPLSIDFEFTSVLTEREFLIYNITCQIVSYAWFSQHYKMRIQNV